jgi:uncharacterized short protein YbdD (DUF466 family)
MFSNTVDCSENLRQKVLVFVSKYQKVYIRNVNGYIYLGWNRTRRNFDAASVKAMIKIEDRDWLLEQMKEKPPNKKLALAGEITSTNVFSENCRSERQMKPLYRFVRKTVAAYDAVIRCDLMGIEQSNTVLIEWMRS